MKKLAFTAVVLFSLVSITSCETESIAEIEQQQQPTINNSDFFAKDDIGKDEVTEDDI